MKCHRPRSAVISAHYRSSPRGSSPTMFTNRFLGASKWWFVSATVLSLLLSGTSVAQTAGQVDPIQLFQSLTPEQQQAAIQSADALANQEDSRGPDSAGTRAVKQVDRDNRPRLPEMLPPAPMGMQAEDTVIVNLSMPTPVERRDDLQELIRLVHSRNPYTLDQDAQLNLPGFPPIKLRGLTDEQAAQRLSAEPELLPFTVRLLRLPLGRTGIAELKPFGYDLFSSAASTYSPVTDVPVPADYVIGSGDELKVQLFGSQNRTLSLTVNRDGSITFPGLGPIQVEGLTFSAAKRLIEARATEQIIGVRANVAMGETRTIRVIVSGEARQRGSYTISGLATMTAALFASGGVTSIASLRDIQLKRQNRVVRRLDLYDLLIRGDVSDDARLLPGDVIFIPPVGATASVDGQVKRPAIYELRGDTSIAELLQIAGGLTPRADSARGSLTRVNESGRRVVFNVDLNLQASRSMLVRNGDELRIEELRPQIDSGVKLSGFLHRPGVVAWEQGLRLSQTISSVDELKPGADQRYVLIRRETGPDRRISVLSADLLSALAAPGSPADIVLEPRDQITVFELAPGRERIIQPLMDELSLQSDLNRPPEVVRVSGQVRAPGKYPLEPEMRVSDLLRAGGNLQAAAYGVQAELARYTVIDSGARQTEIVPIDLVALRSGDASADLLLRPFDYLVVKETPGWTDQESVTLKGEVRLPGVYAIRKGETLKHVLERAGGLTAEAFAKGGAFTRRETKEIQQKEMDRLAARLQSDLASLSLKAAAANQAEASQTLLAGQSLLAQLRGSAAVGRLVIDLPALLSAPAGSAADVELRDGDELVIPKRRNEITVIGEVQNTTSHLYQAMLSRDDYINLSGGMTRKADRHQIYIVRADGNVFARSSSPLKRRYGSAIQPGDTIVVPLDAERMPKLPFWQAVTQILYNVAVSFAAINSF